MDTYLCTVSFNTSITKSKCITFVLQKSFYSHICSYASQVVYASSFEQLEVEIQALVFKRTNISGHLTQLCQISRYICSHSDYLLTCFPRVQCFARQMGSLVRQDLCSDAILFCPSPISSARRRSGDQVVLWPGKWPCLNPKVRRSPVLVCVYMCIWIYITMIQPIFLYG